MKRIAFPGFLLLPLLGTIISCGSTMSLPQYLEHLDSGEYKPCISELEKRNAQEKNNDRIRDNFDLAMIRHYQKDYDSSLSILNSTDRLMDDAVTESITKGFASAVANDNAAEYKGNAYEYIYINVFNALNYYNKGDLEEAAVEVRRLNEKQRNYLNQYGEWIKNDDSQLEISDTYKKLRLDSSKITDNLPKKPSEADIFRDSATARYLSIVFAMMDDSVNNSWNVSADSRTLKALNPEFDVLAESSISDGMGRLDVLAFTGLIGRRGERRLIIGPFPGVQFPTGRHFVYIPAFDLEFVYPEFPAPQTILQPQVMPTFGWGPSFTIYPGKNEIIKMPENTVDSIRIVFDGKNNSQNVSLSLLEDFNYAVKQDVNSKARASYSRSVKRSMVKKFTAVAGATVTLILAEEAVNKEENLFTIAAYATTYLSAAKAADQIDRTETADIRQVYALPAQAYAGGIELPAGKYSFKVQYFAKNGTLLKEEAFKDIEVKNGKTVLVESSCQK
ncbi:hypothetical protein DYE50_00720 [Treponema ruminis]|uniref:Lipoprotein n=1 Tax=Treponema ruminis TaxID=744515 RepID=A0A7W8GBR0_9SPIR|nr:hypothetical protein [Treponema ruminis]MBB5227382.1 hypothetical protein [Treponema ruminis]QSI01104.1 hypothetical protein DYE50_00720 [Treponema ruminis]